VHLFLQKVGWFIDFLTSCRVRSKPPPTTTQLLDYKDLSPNRDFIEYNKSHPISLKIDKIKIKVDRVKWIIHSLRMSRFLLSFCFVRSGMLPPPHPLPVFLIQTMHTSLLLSLSLSLSLSFYFYFYLSLSLFLSLSLSLSLCLSLSVSLRPAYGGGIIRSR
jgi:hypothetical protein